MGRKDEFWLTIGGIPELIAYSPTDPASYLRAVRLAIDAGGDEGMLGLENLKRHSSAWGDAKAKLGLVTDKPSGKLGRPKMLAEDVRSGSVSLSGSDWAWLRRNGNASAEIRRLIAEARLLRGTEQTVAGNELD